jgi:adenylosuccinate lyase
VFERVWRQLKSIGDALAWRAFGYDHPVIVALSRNQSAGPMLAGGVHHIGSTAVPGLT